MPLRRGLLDSSRLRDELWGLGAFGQAGVEAALEILRSELEIAMQQFGAPSLVDIDRTFIA